MDYTADIIRLLSTSGLNVLGVDDDFIYIEDPSCLTRAFQDFLTYAWLAVCLVTVLLLTLWAIAMIRGAKMSAMFSNIKALLIIFATISAVGPIMNTIYRGDVFGAFCKSVPVSLSSINETLSAKISQKDTDFMLYEGIDIQDSGPVDTFDVDMQGASKAMDKLESVSVKIDKELSSQEAQK